MELHLRIGGAAPAGDHAQVQGVGRPLDQRDVVVSIDADHRVSDLTIALAPQVGLRPPFRLLRDATGEVLHETETLGSVGLLSGELLHVVDSSATSTPRATSTGIELSITSGADGGRRQRLHPGTYMVGRAPHVDIVLDDQQVSGEHAQLRLAGDGTIQLLATNTTNPTLVNGRPVSPGAPVAIRAEDLVQMGATTLALRLTRPGQTVGRDRLGHVPFHRTPHEPVQIPTPKFGALSSVPGEPQKRTWSPMVALAPIATGIVMAAVFGSVRFLLFALMSPVVGYAAHRNNNSEQVKKHQRLLARWRERVAERHREVRQALVDERAARLAAAPDVADLARRASERLPNLWERGREFDDFLRIRIGTGDVRSRIQLTLDDKGDQDRLDELRRPLDGMDMIPSVPVTLPLAELGVAAIIGDACATDQVVTAMTLQAACLHSPEELVIVAALDSGRSLLDSLKWLPHVRSATSPLAGEHIATSTSDAEALLRQLIDVAEQRTSGEQGNGDTRWPWLLLLLDKSLDVNTPLLSTLLSHCPRAGISVVWVTDDERRVRREARGVVSVGTASRPSALWTADDMAATGGVLQQLDLDRVKADVAREVCCALSPLRDASSVAAAAGIPRIVPLFDALEVDDVTADWVIDQWQTPKGYSLPAPVGIGTEGQFVLDMVEHGHGPHGLIAGTSGSGKSELLMSIVAGLVAMTPPTRLNLLFVDYKGGAASDVFADLPHTVGRVTNLNAALAKRALVSLRAELNRRMDVLRRHAAKDLEQMVDEHPDDAPPSLLIILDEFATLVKEIPEFMDGVIDIAQRGRSLGIHLLLSTQRPQGAVNDNILANTNLRICLRMIEPTESSQIIGTPDAASIPVPLKGRAFAKLGPGQLAAFQSGFTGAPMHTSVGTARAQAVPFRAGVRPEFRGGAVVTESGGTQLEALMRAIGQAADKLNITEEGRKRRPWRDELPREVSVETLRDQVRAARVDGAAVAGTPMLTDDGVGASKSGDASGRIVAGRDITLGLLDDPARQSQYPAVIDLEEGGGLVVFGTGGSGKTTLLQTAATCAALDDLGAGGGTLTILGLDFSSGALTKLVTLPQTAEVGTWDDLEVVTRMIARLSVEVDRRRQQLRTTPGEDAPSWDGDRVLLLLDGFGNFVEILENNKMYRWVDLLQRLIVDGRQVGVHTILCADRRSAVRSSLMAAFSNRLALRQSDEGDYVAAGVHKSLIKGLTLNPGRGFLNGEQTIQIATPADQPELRSAPGGSAALLTAPEMPVHVAMPDAAPAIRPQGASLPDAALTPLLGIADVTLDLVRVDIRRFDLLVTGPPGSGRSTVLAGLARQVRDAGVRTYAFGTLDSPLADLELTDAAFGSPDAIKERLVQLVEELQASRRTDEAPQPTLVVIDDLDMIEEALGHKGLPSDLMALRGVRIIASTGGGSVMGNNLISSFIRRIRSRIYLQPANADETRTQFPQVAVKVREGLQMPVGRAIFIQSATDGHVVQTYDALAA